MIKIFLMNLAGIFMLIVTSCSRDGEKTKGADYTPIEYFNECIAYEYDIPSLSFGELPNIGYSLESLNDTTLKRDSEGVVLFEWQERFYYHPVSLIHRTFAMLGAFHYLKDTVYLNMAKTSVNRLIKEAVIYDDAVYYPYHFDYKVHSREDARLVAPWFSGMAQGEALGILVRLFNVTQDSSYLEYAHRTFKSLQRIKGPDTPWVSFIDQRGCFWIEEYPLDPPSMTLNGFIAAIFGLYDYYQLTQSDVSGQMLKDCFNTVKNYIPLFRRPGRISYYNLRFQHYDAGYHMFHIKQLRQLEKMSGDPFFGQWADSLKNDYNQ